MAAITAAPVRQPFPVDFYFYLPRERCCQSASRRSPLQTPAAPPLLIITVGPLGRDAATCLCDPVSNPHTHTHVLLPRVLIKQIILHCHPSSCHLPVLHNVMEKLLIYIFGHDASQLVVVSPSACHWYTPPSSSLLLNDFLLPLASFPLSSSALHKSSRSLDPSKANDHHLFSSTAVCFFSFLPMAHFLLPLRAHSFYTYTAVLLPCSWRQDILSRLS